MLGCPLKNHSWLGCPTMTCWYDGWGMRIGMTQSTSKMNGLSPTLKGCRPCLTPWPRGKLGCLAWLAAFLICPVSRETNHTHREKPTTHDKEIPRLPIPPNITQKIQAFQLPTTACFNLGQAPSRCRTPPWRGSGRGRRSGGGAWPRSQNVVPSTRKPQGSKLKS